MQPSTNKFQPSSQRSKSYMKSSATPYVSNAPSSNISLGSQNQGSFISQQSEPNAYKRETKSKSPF